MGLFKKGADGYSTFGKLWRSAATTATKGTIDFMQMSQQNRQLKAAGGSNAQLNAITESVASAALSGANTFIKATGAEPDPTTKAGVDYYIKKYGLLAGGAVVVVVLLVVLLTRGKKKRY